MREVFDKLAFQFLIKWEGGYSNDPDDFGGETKYGISHRAYPHLNIKALTLEQAQDIYYADYWLGNRSDELPIIIAVLLFDFSINSGKLRAVKELQKCVNRTTEENLLVDGINGDVTISAVKKCDSKLLAYMYIQARIRFLSGLKNDKFFKGWISRVLALVDYVGL